MSRCSRAVLASVPLQVVARAVSIYPARPAPWHGKSAICFMRQDALAEEITARSRGCLFALSLLRGVQLSTLFSKTPECVLTNFKAAQEVPFFCLTNCSVGYPREPQLRSSWYLLSLSIGAVEPVFAKELNRVLSPNCFISTNRRFGRTEFATAPHTRSGFLESVRSCHELFVLRPENASKGGDNFSLTQDRSGNRSVLSL